MMSGSENRHLTHRVLLPASPLPEWVREPSLTHSHWGLKSEPKIEVPMTSKNSAKCLVESIFLCIFAPKKLKSMEQQTDIRWIQRYANFHKACTRLLEVTEADRFMDDLSELEIEGLVQRFEYTFELAWKVLQDLLIFKGYEFMLGPNGTMKMAFEDGLISDHDSWRKMAKSRNTLSHVYDEEEVLPIVRLIYSDYAPLLKQLDESLGQLSLKQDYQEA